LLASLGLEERNSHSAVPGLSRDDAHSLAISVPPLDEQRRIAEVLGALDDRIEACHSVTRSVEDLLLVAFDKLAEQLDGSSVSRMADVAVFVGGGTPSTKEPKYWSPAIHSWATPKDLSQLSVPMVLGTERQLSDEGRDRLSSKLLPAGSVVLSSRAPIGYLAWLGVDAAINQGMIGFLRGGKLPPSYIYAWAKRNMGEIEARAGGTTFAEISKKNFGQIELAVPTDEQLTNFETHSTPLVEAIDQLAREIAALQETRDFLLPRLVSGELRVEAAEELVEDVA
jgi:type I restriction enzyme S subunit